MRHQIFVVLLSLFGTLSVLQGCDEKSKVATVEVLTEETFIVSTINSAHLDTTQNHTTSFWHMGGEFSATYSEQSWDQAVQMILNFSPSSFDIRPYSVHIESFSSNKVCWKKEYGFSLWRTMQETSFTTKTARTEKQKPNEGNCFYITKNTAGELIVVKADSNIEAGLKARGLTLESDPTLTEKAIGPFPEYEAERIVKQMTTQLLGVPPGNFEETGSLHFRVPLHWTTEQIDREAERLYGSGRKWQDSN